MDVAQRVHAFARTCFGKDNRQAVFALGSLLYLVFLFMPALVPRMAPAAWLLPTLLSLPVFLALYVLVWRSASPRIEGAVLAIGMLGLALLPANPAAHTYIIYAAATATGALPWRRACGLSALVLVAYIFWHLYLGYPPMMAVLTCILVLTIGVGNATAVAYQRKDAALRLSQEEVRQLARVAERERIARDLHDLLGHTLSVIVLKAELAHRLYDHDRDGARREIADVERIARETLGQVRRAVAGIRAAGLRAELASARLALDAVGMQLEQAVDTQGLAPEVETALALVLREAITNVVRHSGARRVQVRLARVGAQFVLSIEDDGRGRGGKEGSGVAGMRERIEGLGGQLTWVSDGRGTRLLASVATDTALDRSSSLARMPV